jgi:hypothetical protein
MRLQSALLVILLVLSQAVIPQAFASTMNLTLTITPQPIYNQLTVGNTYTFNVTFSNDGIVVYRGEPANTLGTVKYTGNMQILLDLTWKGYGSYDFGESTTGYTLNLDSLSMNKTLILPQNGTSTTVLFNYTFVRDGFDFSLKPYENLELTVASRLYYEVYNVSLAKPFRGPSINSTKTTLDLLDETKIDYVKGKYENMLNEIEPIRSLSGAKYINVNKFIGYLEQVNESINKGDYFTALAEYQRYDNDYRSTLISSLTNEAVHTLNETKSLRSQNEELNSRISTLESQYNGLQTEYNGLNAKYEELSNTYQAKQAELQSAKQNLITAITAVFLAAVLFFFIGRRSVTSKTLK